MHPLPTRPHPYSSRLIAKGAGGDKTGSICRAGKNTASTTAWHKSTDRRGQEREGKMPGKLGLKIIMHSLLMIWKVSLSFIKWLQYEISAIDQSKNERVGSVMLCYVMEWDHKSEKHQSKWSDFSPLTIHLMYYKQQFCHLTNLSATNIQVQEVKRSGLLHYGLSPSQFRKTSDHCTVKLCWIHGEKDESSSTSY